MSTKKHPLKRGAPAKTQPKPRERVAARSDERAAEAAAPAAPAEPVTFDPTPYVTAPMISVGEGISLVKSLVAACPGGPPAAVEKALAFIEGVAAQASSDLVERKKQFGQAATDQDARAVDNEADHIWGGLRQRLQAYAMLPARYPVAAEAAALDQKLFGDGGTEFLKAKYPAQRTAMETHLALIDSENLTSDVDRLAGKEYLEAARDVQLRYDAFVAASAQRDKALGQDLQATRRGLQNAIVYYASAWIGTVAHDDASSATRAAKALLPILTFRASQHTSKSAPTATADPSATQEEPVDLKATSKKD